MEKVISLTQVRYEKMYASFYKTPVSINIGFFNKHDIVKIKNAKRIG